MILISSCNCLCPIHRNQMSSREWRYSWSSADRRCSNSILVISNFIAYSGALFNRGVAVYIFSLNIYLLGSTFHVCSYLYVYQHKLDNLGNNNYVRIIMERAALDYKCPLHGQLSTLPAVMDAFVGEMLNACLLQKKSVPGLIHVV